MKFKKLAPWATLPTRAHMDDLGLDLYALNGMIVQGKSCTLVPTGIACQFDANTGGIIKDRSSVASKRRLYVKAGVIDPSYRGEIFVLLENPNDNSQLIQAGEKIAQMVLVKTIYTNFEEVTEFDNETERGDKGFGSTDD